MEGLLSTGPTPSSFFTEATLSWPGTGQDGLATQKGTGNNKGKKLQKLLEDYAEYKKGFAKNIKFDPQLSNLSKNISPVPLMPANSPPPPPAATIEYAPLKLVQIFFDTATYDEIERDVKVTLEAQLGLIGGTMGLLTGFSILSGVEIVYYFIKLLMSLRSKKVRQQL